MELYNEILRAALTLPYKQRWKLVDEINETLHPPPKYKSEKEFHAMLEERIENIKAGRGEYVEPEVVFRQLRETISKNTGKLLFE